MDLNNIGETQDRISDLPDSVLHHILSFLVVKNAARTSLLSKRWNHIWTSAHTLVIPSRYSAHGSKPPSLSETQKFMDFMDRTLLLHDTSSSIQKFHLHTHRNMNSSQVHSWIENVTRCNVKDVYLYLHLGRPFYVPLSLFTCHSLVKLELYALSTIHFPKTFYFPRLKSLQLYGIQFNDDNCWNEQHLSNCHVLEDLILHSCSWFGVRNFCISSPSLKFLKIDQAFVDDGLQNCALKINAPNLVSITYTGQVAKEYVISCQRLEYATVFLFEYYVLREQKPGYVAIVSKLFRALAHVRSLTIHTATLETLSIVDNLVNILPMYHLDELILAGGETTDKLLFPFLKAAPNLTRLVFDDSYIEDNEEDEHMLTPGCLFEHLRSVRFTYFCGDAQEMRWLKLVLEKARALQTISVKTSYDMDPKRKQVLMSDLLSLPKASRGCAFQFL